MLLWTWRGSVAVVVLAMAVLVGNLQLPADDAAPQSPPQRLRPPPEPSRQVLRKRPPQTDQRSRHLGRCQTATGRGRWQGLPSRRPVGDVRLSPGNEGTRIHRVGQLSGLSTSTAPCWRSERRRAIPSSSIPSTSRPRVPKSISWSSGKTRTARITKCGLKSGSSTPKTGKEMPFPWVFAGSGHWTEESTGKVYYYGDDGDFICVSNFPTATLDLPVESSQANGDLLFTAFTETDPAQGYQGPTGSDSQAWQEKAGWQEPGWGIPRCQAQGQGWPGIRRDERQGKGQELASLQTPRTSHPPSGPSGRVSRAAAGEGCVKRRKSWSHACAQVTLPLGGSDAQRLGRAVWSAENRESHACA